VTVLDVTVNVVVVADAGTLTVAGTVSTSLLFEMATARSAAVAELRLTVHVPVAPEDNVVGEHANDISVAWGIRLIEKAFVLPFRVAVTTAV